MWVSPLRTIPVGDGTQERHISAVVVNMVVKDKKGSVAETKGKSKEAAKEESKCICEICTCG